jgi:ubiquinone/menaquinone biosynthesis C-methylase UbiE
MKLLSVSNKIYKFRNKGDKKVFTAGRTLNSVAKIYDFLSPFMTFFQEGRICRRAIELLELKGKEKVLDIGCGTGLVTIEVAKNFLHNKNGSIVGLDAANKMVEVARKKSRFLNNIHFDVGIAEQLPYKDESFDCVISAFFFHHINFELKRKVLREIRRVLKKEGCVVIVDVDIPTNIFGTACAWGGYFIFRQKEIKENILGELREAIDFCQFRDWYTVSSHLGYISIFKLEK